MMKGIQAVLVLLIAVHFMAPGLTCYAQPNISKDNIPSDVPANVREKIEGLYSLDPIKRAEAGAHLALMGHRAVPAIPFLIGIFGDDTLLIEEPAGSFRLPGYHTEVPNTTPSSQAVKALIKIGKPAVGPLVASLRNEDWIIRAFAAAVLGKIEDPRVVKPLILALKDEDGVVRINATIALGGIRDSRSVKPLIAALRDEQWRVRMYASRSLGALVDTGAVDPLIDALNDKVPRVAAAAAEALKRITGEEFGLDPEKWRRWREDS
jgi:hypothetical protein